MILLLWALVDRRAESASDLNYSGRNTLASWLQFLTFKLIFADLLVCVQRGNLNCLLISKS